MKQKIQSKRLAISNVGKDSGKRTKIVAWEQVRRDRKRIVGNAKDDAVDSADLWRGRPHGFDALGLSDSGRARYGVGYPLRPSWPSNAPDCWARSFYSWRSKGLWRAFYSGNLPATKKGVISLLAVWPQVEDPVAKSHPPTAAHRSTLHSSATRPDRKPSASCCTPKAPPPPKLQ